MVEALSASSDVEGAGDRVTDQKPTNFLLKPAGLVSEHVRCRAFIYHLLFDHHRARPKPANTCLVSSLLRRFFRIVPVILRNEK